jgi:Tfp pilus assembly protein PilF
MYRKAVKLDPESASAQYNLGSWLARSGKYAEAESHLRKAVTKDPNTRNYTGLGIVLWQQGRTDQAIENLRAAIEADPKNPAAHQKLAEILESQGRNDEARRESELAKTLGQGSGVTR